MLESITKPKVPQKENVLCFNITCSVCNTWDILGFPITKELLFDLMMAAESLTILVSVGGDADNTGLIDRPMVYQDQQGQHVCWWWIMVVVVTLWRGMGRFPWWGVPGSEERNGWCRTPLALKTTSSSPREALIQAAECKGHNKKAECFIYLWWDGCTWSK